MNRCLYWILVCATTVLPVTCFAFNLIFNFGLGGSQQLWTDLVQNFAADKTSIAFGNVSTGVDRIGTIRFSNTGNDIAEGITITTAGTAFRTYSTPTFSNLSAGKHRDFRVAFRPAIQQNYSGSVTASLPNVADVVIALTGIGVSSGDTTPDAFSFVDQPDVALSSTITSAAITVTGIDAASAISVTGGTYDINSSGSFTSSPGTVNNNDTVRARHTSSNSNSTATDTIVTIGGISDTFTSTTLAASGYTTLFSSFWDGSGVTDSGGTGTGIPWTGSTDTGSQSANTGNAYIVTSSVTTESSLRKTGMSAKADIQLLFDLKLTSYNGDAQFAAIKGGAGDVIILYFTRSGSTINGFKVLYYDGAGSPHFSNAMPYTFTSGVAYTFKAQLKCSSTTGTSDGTIKIYVNDVQQDTTITTSTRSTTVTGVYIGQLYADNAGGGGTMTFDNLVYGWK